MSYIPPTNARGLYLPKREGDEVDDMVNWQALDAMIEGTHPDVKLFSSVNRGATKAPLVQPGSRVMASPPTVTLVREAGIAAEFPTRVDISPLDSRLLSTANLLIDNPGWVVDGAVNWSVVGDAINTPAQRQPGGTQMHTIFTDADKIAVKVFAYQGAPKIQFKINGEVVSLTPVTVPADSAYSWYVFTIAGTREPRLVTALIAGEPMMFCGFSVGPTAAVFPCPRPRRDLLAGDSYVASQGVTTPTDTLPVKLAEKLGSLNVWASGIGGTGYLATNGGIFQTLRQRIDSDIVPFVQPGDRVWILMGTNDWGGGFSAAAVAVELTLTIGEIRDKCPGVEVVVATPWRPRAGSNADAAYDNTILAAIQSLGVQAVDVRNVLTGTGKVGTTTGNGNSDIAIQADGLHPTAIGQGILTAFLALHA